jgi:hypothetical protein
MENMYRGLSSWCLRLVLRRCSLVLDVTKLLGSVERKQKIFSVFQPRCETVVFCFWCVLGLEKVYRGGIPLRMILAVTQGKADDMFYVIL